ncbi:Oidioi.mRNA.OKI2018_I69.chr1.g1615.t1.cds [Oikopleura dioica]|uniref:Oidioi.mRNA.OKI2018_I69.chr1.g1615.t1.cds n=1 Tax=Oikopleura dioica TaxID=34765 RepID=A0ABN7SNH2_OIKDI|nr:Oidioi.mRNA.OKI2018_I69.chr1.g1615.t1.cds [Oikopleura dioica]
MLCELKRGKICVNLIRRSSLKTSNPMIRSTPEPTKIKAHQIATLNRFNLRPYPQKYPALIVRGDGSTYRVWSTEEPQEIVRFPIDVSNMSEMDRTRLLSKRYGKQVKTRVVQSINVEDEDDQEEELGDFSDYDQR